MLWQAPLPRALVGVERQTLQALQLQLQLQRHCRHCRPWPLLPSCRPLSQAVPQCLQCRLQARMRPCMRMLCFTFPTTLWAQLQHLQLPQH